MDQRTIDQLAAAAYDSALGTAPWTDFLGLLNSVLGARSGVLFSQRLDLTGPQFFGACGVDPDAATEYEQYFAPLNVFMREGRALLAPAGTILTNETLCRDEVLLNSEYYNDFMRRYDLRHALAIACAKSATAAVHLSLFRPHGASRFSEEDLRSLSRLVPHLQRAVQVHQRLSEAHERAGALQAGFEQLNQGVALLDRKGLPIYVNGALQQLAADRDGLVLNASGISAMAPATAQRLRTLTTGAASGASGGTVGVRRPSGKPPYSVVVSPVLTRLDAALERAAVLLLVSDPSVHTRPDAELLRQLYDLTPAEAKLALHLANGATLREAAEQLQITQETARTHLKRILGKTGARRQAELVRQIVLGLGWSRV